MDQAVASHEKAALLDPTWQDAFAQTYTLAGRKEKAMAVLEDLSETQ